MARMFPDKTLDKTTTEEIDVEQDFVDEVPTSDSIEAVGANTTVTAVDSDGVAAPTVLGAITLSGTKLKVRTKAGTHGQSYLVKYVAKMITSTELREKYLTLNVRNPVVTGLMIL